MFCRNPSEYSEIEVFSEEAYVDVGKADPEEAAPGPEHMPLVEAGDAVIALVSDRGFREVIHEAADQVAQGVAAKRVAAKEEDIERESPARTALRSSHVLGEPGVVVKKTVDAIRVTRTVMSPKLRQNKRR